MFRIMKNEQGYSLIEMAVAMLLLVMFGLGIFMLAASSSGAYEMLTSKKSVNEEIRIASSYITTKLRQNDREDSIQVIKNYTDSSDALIINETISGEVYQTWIYMSNGKLREVTIPETLTPSDDLSFIISEIDTFELSVDGKTVFFSIAKDDKSIENKAVSLRTTVGYKE